MSARAVGVCLALAALALPREASAHLVSTRFGELYSGFLHPLLSFQHVVPWLGLGLLGGLHAVHIARWSVVTLPAGVGLGVLAAGVIPGLAPIAYANLLSFLVVGGLAVSALELSSPSFVALGLVLGLSHGYANGASELGGSAQLLYASGVTLAAYVLVTLVTACARALATRATWGKTALRAMGSWIAAIGVVFGGFTLLQPV